MPNFNIQIRTKLGSTRSKVVAADSEIEAIIAAKEAFPLYEKVWSDGLAENTIDDETRRAESQARIDEMKRNADIAKVQSRRTQGLAWLSLGLVLTVASFAFYREATLIALGPVIWGVFMFVKANSRLRSLAKD